MLLRCMPCLRHGCRAAGKYEPRATGPVSPVNTAANGFSRAHGTEGAARSEGGQKLAPRESGQLDCRLRPSRGRVDRGRAILIWFAHMCSFRIIVVVSERVWEMSNRVKWTSPRIKALPIKATEDPTLPGCTPSGVNIPQKCDS